MYNYNLSGPRSTVLSLANQASTYEHGGVTSPELCNVNSSLGQNQFQIAAGGSPERHRLRSNDALHYISQMLIEDIDERVDICQGEASLQAAEKPFLDLLGQVQPPVTSWSSLHNNNQIDNPDKSRTSCYKRLWSTSFDDLEARLAGIGGQVYRDLMERRTSTTYWLDAYSLFIASCPFDRTSYYFANQAILDVSQGKPRVHIVDFGISFGFQWPLMIQKFAQQEEGAPKLWITGIDVPQPGFLPCKMIEETGKRLADYANMFKVPFQYQGIAASRWKTIKIEDLNLTRMKFS
ncbi:hypothetical protein D1007_24375 [Hordeum vulgare]|nr:hypothetical protein D1007_24375 [Hordeum vulgare]